MEKRKRSIDMLSGLPDEILHHILSFIPTKTSVSTSILAKRWRFMWTHVPNLEFYKHDFRGNRKNKQPLDIINRVIMLHEAKIVNSFTISLYNVKVGAFPLGTLIIYLIKRSVRNLYLGFGYEQNDKIVCTLPRLLLTCKTLVDLTLVYCGVIPSTGELFLPNLKKLNLSYVMYEDDKSLPHLLSGCPVLEELTIRDCFRKGQNYSGCIIISSPTIKTLTVDFHHEGDIHSHNLEEMLIIDVPALINLNLDCCDFKRVKSLRKTMSFLIAADFRFEGDWHDCEFDCNVCRCSIEFLSCLCQVKFLKITSRFDDMLVGIVRTTGSMVKFVNLTKLELNLPVNWYNVVKFLEVIDNLEVLIIHGSTRTTYNGPERVPSCMLSSLRTVRMHRLNFFYGDCENVFEMVRYILRNAQVLERMEIDPTDNLYNKGRSLDALRKISLFERGSKSCQVAFNTD